MTRFRLQKPGGFALIFGPIILIVGISEKNSTGIVIGLLLVLAAVALLFLNKD